MQKTLIIEIPYGGLGDHLFHSHLPRIAKETGRYDTVYISKKTIFRHPDNKYIVWDLNPFIDGFIDQPGIKCNLVEILKNVKKGVNLLDAIMLAYNLDDTQRGHEPEIYYKPHFNATYHNVIFDPNYLSWVGVIDKRDIMYFLKKRKIQFDAVMKIRTDKSLYIPKASDVFIETVTLKDFCDLIYSSKKLFCLTSGTASLASSLGKPATVFYGAKQDPGFRHSKIHEYIKVERCPKSKILSFIKLPFYFIKKKLADFTL
ncbi:MAG: hypothetical protein H0W84_11360 [Bacteroidetes bacterium]|nr:hypothetical protein [Bacteroidota bacterium]